MTTVSKLVNDIRSKLTEIDYLVLDWMADMDMPEGTAISGDVYYAKDKYLDAIVANVNGLLKAISDGTYCADCGKPLLEDDMVWHDHECFCKMCAIRKHIDF